jgi:putative ABC transport system permease protein
VISSIGNDTIVRSAIDPVQSQITKIYRRSQVMGELVFGAKTMMHTLSGVDWQAEKDLPGKLKPVKGSLDQLGDPQAVILPQTVAEKLGIAIGENVLIRLSTVTGQQNVGELRLIAIIKDQTNFGVSTGYVDLAYLNGLLGLKRDAYQTLNIFLADMQTMDTVAESIYTKLDEQAEVEPRLKINFQMDENEDDSSSHKEEREAIMRMFGGGQKNVEEPWKGTKFAVSTLNDIMSPVMSMVGVLNTVSLVVFLILLAITMIGITNTFRMILIERTQEIGTMRAFGMQRQMVRNIFLGEAMFIGLSGAIAGLVASGLLMLVLSAFHFNDASMLQFFLNNGRFTFILSPANVVLDLVLILLMTLFAAYRPARAAARLRPAEALRAHF